MNQTSPKLSQRSSVSQPIETITLDCEHILSCAGGEPERLIQFCSIFLSQIPMHMDSLRSALRQSETLAAERALQLLSSSLAIFGTGPISLTLEILNSALLGGRRKQVRRESLCLQRQVRILIPQVQRLMLEVSIPRTAIQ
jgi:hypothetical protein